MWGTPTLWIAGVLGVLGMVIGFLLLWVADRHQSLFPVVVCYALAWLVGFLFAHNRIGPNPAVDSLWIATVVIGTMALLVLPGCLGVLTVACWVREAWRSRADGDGNGKG